MIKIRPKWPKAVVSHLATKRSHNLKTFELCTPSKSRVGWVYVAWAKIPLPLFTPWKRLLQPSEMLTGNWNWLWSKGTIQSDCSWLKWQICTGLSGLFSFCAQLERTQGRDMMQQGHIPFFGLLLRCCKNLARSLLNFWHQFLCQ